ncbi:MAG TPA: type II secretion system protein [Candidatus Omnitrophota bacterium]|nr:type II secretion system protein [Candidatus Omnitrophota bacterium]
MFHQGGSLRKQRDIPRSAGFTLTEVMIVVIIIGVLATLAIPRFFGQTEKAKAAEAINMLSVIRRAQLQYYDAHDRVYVSIPDNCSPSGADVATSKTDFLEKLGIEIPACANAHWTYSTANVANSGGTNSLIVTATRKPIGGEKVSGALTIDDNGTWSGAGEYAKSAEKYWPF